MKKKKIVIGGIAIITLLAFITAFTSRDNKSESMQDMTKITKAVCVLYPTQGNQTNGVVTFNKTPDGINVVADVHGLTKGKHGFHIHQYGDCTSADGSSAGGHFNPDKMEHGGPMATMRHAGDLGNVEADASGNAHLNYTDKMISFEGKNSIIGRGIVVHLAEDDLHTQPTGAAGARVACGVIGIAKEE
jgi:superoxide dismutase, Cu-Zn family